LNEDYYSNDDNENVVKTSKKDDNDNEESITLRKDVSKDLNDKKDALKE